MKVLMLLGLVGAAIYGVLVLSSDLLPRDPAETVSDGRSLGDPNDRRLRSWGTDLTSLARSSSQIALPSSPEPALTAGSQTKPTIAGPGDTAYQPLEWAKVVLAAKVHADASVSSPTLRFYPAGTALQVVNRQNGWIQIIEPTSAESGWVFGQYLVASEDPTANRTAMTSATKVTVEQAQVSPAQTAKKWVKASQRTVRMPDEFAGRQFNRRAGRRAASRSGLFFLGRFARGE